MAPTFHFVKKYYGEKNHVGILFRHPQPPVGCSGYGATTKVSLPTVTIQL